MASSSDLQSVKRCLLIGNGKYRRGHQLKYSENNLNDLEEKLSQLSFEITIGRNLTCEEIDLILENFVKEINANDVILFYYYGYGIHLNNENYLIPIDNQNIEDPQMFQYQCIHLSTIFQMIIDRHPLGAIFLFDSSYSYQIFDHATLKISEDFGGFYPIESFPNTLIMFSIDANKITDEKCRNGRNTTFVSYLLQYIDQMNLSIEELMDIISDEIINESDNQIFPFKISSIKKNLFFNYQIQTGSKKDFLFEINQLERLIFHLELTQRRSLFLEEILLQCQNGSLVDLRNRQLVDRDMKVIVEEVLMKKQFTRLWLNGNHLTPIGASTLASALNFNTSLERLYLHGNFISDIGLKYISKSLSNANKTLKILDLQQNQITDLGIEHLAQMIGKNSTLISLSLDFNLITDKGMKIFFNAFLSSNSSIQYLGLSNNQFITDLSFDYFEKLIQNNKSINEISLHHCHLSKLIKEKLQKMCKRKKHFSIYLNNWNE